mgnify:CR=1 FL=1
MIGGSRCAGTLWEWKCSNVSKAYLCIDLLIGVNQKDGS